MSLIVSGRPKYGSTTARAAAASEHWFQLEWPFYKTRYFCRWLHTATIFSFTMTNRNILLVCCPLLFQLWLLHRLICLSFWSVLSHLLSWHTQTKTILRSVKALRGWQTPARQSFPMSPLALLISSTHVLTFAFFYQPPALPCSAPCRDLKVLII